MSERPRRRKHNGRGQARTVSGPARIETSAGGVVCRPVGGDVLVLLIRDPYANWGLPKGHVERGETPVQAALREVAEETGLTDLRPMRALPSIDWYFRDRGQLVHKYCHFFLMESATGEPRPQLEEGISACIWLPLAEAIRRVTYDNAREVLRAVGQWVEQGSKV